MRVEEYAWDRIGDHSFVRRGGAVRTGVVTVGRDATHVLSGVQELVVLNSTDSEFKGFLRDEFTTLPEADDRILATSLVARWRPRPPTTTRPPTNDGLERVVRRGPETLLDTFAGTYSRALQETLYAMGGAVLDAPAGARRDRFSAPNKHHFLVDFSGFEVDGPLDGLSNDGEVFIAADRPYGLIEAQVTRDDAPDAGDAWLAVPGFC